mgnify:CR=1 FL=1
MSKNLVEILDGYKVGELKELAKTSGLKGYSKLKKAELVEAVSKQLEQVEVASLDVPDEIKNIFVKEETKENDEAELISVYYGEDVTEEDAEAVVAKIEEKYPDTDVELQPGGQPIYYYLVSVE